MVEDDDDDDDDEKAIPKSASGGRGQKFLISLKRLLTRLCEQL